MTTHCRVIKPKTYAADCQCRRVRVRVSEGRDERQDALRALVRAGIAVLLTAPIGSPNLDRRVRALAEDMVRLLADKEFNSVCGEMLPAPVAESPADDSCQGRTP